MSDATFPFEDLLVELQGEVVGHMGPASLPMFALASKAAYAHSQGHRRLPYELLARRAAREGNAVLLNELLSYGAGGVVWDFERLVTDACESGHLDLAEQLMTMRCALMDTDADGHPYVVQWADLLEDSLAYLVRAGHADVTLRRAYAMLRDAIRQEADMPHTVPEMLCYASREVEKELLLAGRVELLAEFHCAYAEFSQREGVAYEAFNSGRDALKPLEWALEGGHLRAINAMVRRVLHATDDCVAADASPTGIVTAQTVRQIIDCLYMSVPRVRRLLMMGAIRRNDAALLETLLAGYNVVMHEDLYRFSREFVTPAHAQTFDVLIKYAHAKDPDRERMLLLVDRHVTGHYVRFAKSRGYAADLGGESLMSLVDWAPLDLYEALVECYPELLGEETVPCSVYHMLNSIAQDEMPVITADARAVLASDATVRSWFDDCLSRVLWHQTCATAALRPLFQAGLLTPSDVCALFLLLLLLLPLRRVLACCCACSRSRPGSRP